MSQIDRPNWWPQNPYPKTIFTMTEEGYIETVPDPKLRTRISGFLGRLFWEAASDSIWEAWQNHLEDRKP